MSKLRVYEIAKILNKNNKEIISKLQELGITVKNHMSTLENEEAKRLENYYNQEKEGGRPKAPVQKPAETQQEKPRQAAEVKEGNKPVTHKQQTERPVENRPNNHRPASGQAGNGQRPAPSQHQQSGQGQRPHSPSTNQRSNQSGAGQNQSARGQGARGQNAAQGQRAGQSQSANHNQNNRGQSGQGQNSQGQNQGARPKSNTPFQKGPQNQNHRGQGTASNQQNKSNSNQRQNQKPQQTRQHQGGKPPARQGGPKKQHQETKVAEQTKAIETPMEKQENEIKLIQVPVQITVAELAGLMGQSASTIIKALMKKGTMATVNQEISYSVASEICEEFGIITEEEPEVDLLEKLFEETDEDESKMVKRPPVVVVMGHVDHGKTSLLDVIRHSNVTDKEAGGITQHIGAYTVSIDGNPITFLDTPGHEAFTAMRMRGAQVTDIAILVVAADDGVMPQTVEAINHAKAANVDIIVALNKIDKPSANPDRVKQELAEYGLLVEDWGGDVICVPVSAMNRTGIDNLLEMIILVSEMKELKANPNKYARGTIIEAMLDKGRGPVSTVLVQNGSLSVGDPVVAGSTFGKVRAMMDDKGRKVKKAGPSIPVEILGLSEVPMAGDAFYVCQSEKQARQFSEAVHAKDRVEMTRASAQKVSLEDLFTQIQAGNVKDLNIVVKADVQGSVEAVKMSLEKLSNEEVRIRIIHGGVGAITESDVMLASTSNAIIIGFNVRPEPTAKTIAEKEKVDVRLYRIIYSAIEDITAAMKGMLDPVYQEKVIGHAEIRQLFKASNVGTIGGSYVTDGKFTRNAKVRIVRDGKVVYEGTLDTLKRFKDDVKEVNAGYECGLLFNKYNDIKEGDIVEAFIMEEIPR